MSGALAARQRRDRGVMSAEDQKKAEMLERRQAVMNQWVGRDLESVRLGVEGLEASWKQRLKGSGEGSSASASSGS